MTDHELLRRAAIGMSNAATRARMEGDVHSLTYAGICLGLHVASALSSDDMYLQEIAASALDAWTRGEFKGVEGLHERLAKVCAANWNEREKDGDDCQYPHRGRN